jgi:hypothetical protein
MPKRILRKPTIVSWAILIGLLLGLLYSVWHYAPTSLVVMGLCLLVLGPLAVYDTRRYKRHLAELAASRRGESICTFARQFDTRAIDTWVVRAVYEELQSYLNGSYMNFPIRPSDNPKTDLEIDPEDLDMDLVSHIAERTGRSLERAEQNPLYGHVQTVEDIVRFFNAQPKITA